MKQVPDWFGCGRTITSESWNKFVAARKEYYLRVDKLIVSGAPNDPLLGHPNPNIIVESEPEPPDCDSPLRLDSDRRDYEEWREKQRNA